MRAARLRDGSAFAEVYVIQIMIAQHFALSCVPACKMPREYRKVVVVVIIVSDGGEMNGELVLAFGVCTYSFEMRLSCIIEIISFGNVEFAMSFVAGSYLF